MNFANGQPEPSHYHSVHHTKKRHFTRHVNWAERTVRIELFIILLGCALLLIAVSLFLGFNSSNFNSEYDKVATNKYQAVFLNGGAARDNNGLTTYFGRLKAINEKYYVLQDIYYLTPDSSKSSNQQLTKLGCDQLHAPYDQMVINRSQVAFWENIQPTGTVAKAIDAYKKKFPNGPQCNTSSSGTTPSSSTSTPATTPPATTQSTNQSTP